jgi:hypothetical protein
MGMELGWALSRPVGVELGRALASALSGPVGAELEMELG